MALGFFVAAILSLRDVPARQCQQEAQEDRRYAVVFQGPFRVDRSVYQLTVTRGGTPVTGAMVCVRVGHGGAEGLPELVAANLATEVSSGRYEVVLSVEARGEWNGRVVVRTPGSAPVEVPVSFEVQRPAG